MNKTYHCKRCRSQDVNFYGKAVWCWESQDMVLDYVIDDNVADCWECDTETDVVVRTEDGLPLSEEDLFEARDQRRNVLESAKA